ncbi:ecotropic viral integration site 5 protein homolog isoform X7 [Chiloscyllium plagiosum]|uniref:ecotropic viral integration site 5 protein homolog isoform X7 n=1 Tax=Chiloscyllium plagiosum TaxID=36176 RepID=UPI001CB7B4FD|nr:ecotropic viral integration site 5 protein homolog isoform X7 [Chiloscyllium plagiosum]
MKTLTLQSLVPMASPAVSPDSSSSDNLSPDELELLAKLEEQNRLLEADSKSLRSVNGSRRNSSGSLVSSSSASSNLSHLEEDTWILWGRLINEWEDVRKKKEKLLRELIRKGIPHHFRGIVWQLLCNATDMPVKNQYSELLKMTSPCEKLIRRDIARTYPEHDFFKGQDSLGQEVLFNVMKAYSLVDREVGYCQGSAFIVGLLLMQMPEEEAFCVFVRLMQEYRLRELFKPSMAELGLCIYQFEYLIQDQLPELHVHFRSQSFHTSMYASSWFLTIFLTTFSLPLATRIFDIFMYEGLEIVFRIGMAILQFNQVELMQLDMEGMSQHFQKVIPQQFDGCPDKLVLKAYQVKYNTKKMKKLEKEYTTIKNKEMEEQIEIKCDHHHDEEIVMQLKMELEQSRLREAETLTALKEMQDKVLEMEKRNSSLPDENNIIRLQEELKALKLREAEAVTSMKELHQKVKDLDEHWQRHLARTGGRWKDSPRKNATNELHNELLTVRFSEAQAHAELRELRHTVLELEAQNQVNTNLLNRTEQTCTGLQDKLQYITAQNKGLQTQLSETRRKQAEVDCKNKEEVMAVRFREADSIAAIAELRQRIAELEIQREEGRIQGQLNNSDSNQIIRELKDQITELKTEIRLFKGQGSFPTPMSFDGIHIVNHMVADDESTQSSDEDLLPSPMGISGLQEGLYPIPHGNGHFLRGLEISGKDSDGSTDSDQEERNSALELEAEMANHIMCNDSPNKPPSISTTV